MCNSACDEAAVFGEDALSVSRQFQRFSIVDITSPFSEDMHEASAEGANIADSRAQQFDDEGAPDFSGVCFFEVCSVFTQVTG